MFKIKNNNNLEDEEFEIWKMRSIFEVSNTNSKLLTEDATSVKLKRLKGV